MSSWMKRKEYLGPSIFICMMMIISWAKIYAMNYYWFFNNLLMELQSTALFFMQIAFFAIGGMMFGFLADRFEKEKIIVTTFIIDSFGIVMLYYFQDFFMMGIASAVILFCIGGEFSIGLALIAQKIKKEERAFWTGLFLVGVFGGMLVFLIIEYIEKFVMELRNTHFAGTSWNIYFIYLGIISILFLFNEREFIKQIFQQKKSQNKLPGINLSTKTQWNWLSIINRTITFAFFSYTFYGISLYLILVQIIVFKADFRGIILLITLGGLTGTIFASVATERLGERKTVALFTAIYFFGVITFAFIRQSGFDFPIFLIFFGTGSIVAFFKHIGADFPKQWIGTGISITVHLGHTIGLFSALGTILVLFVFGLYGALLVFSLTFLLSSLLIYLHPIYSLLKRKSDANEFTLNCSNEVEETAEAIMQK